MRRRLAISLAAVVIVITAVASGLWFFWLPEYRPGLAPGESYGVDVSAHQGRIDWAKVRTDHIRFAYIKATEGSDHVDRRFAENWSGASSAGIRVGAYHFFTLCTPGAAQAENFLRTVQLTPGSLPPALDLELAGNCKARPDAPTVEHEVSAFVDAVESRTGRPMMFYVGDEFSERYPFATRSGHERWIRRFLRHPSERTWSIWQVDSYAHVNGVHGKVDLDVMRRT
jgi:lysozyme